jgi:hypothetical protein
LLKYQSALVYQSAATRTTRVPPAKGKVQPGNRRERTMATLAAKAPYRKHPASEWTATRESSFV